MKPININVIKRAVALTILCLLVYALIPKYQIGYAAWYAREGDTCDPFPHITMANGKELNDEAYTCAIWRKKFNTILLVTNLANGASVKVMVTDRGPAKRLARQGRIIDLSKAAFARIADLDTGVIKVKVGKGDL